MRRPSVDAGLVVVVVSCAALQECTCAAVALARGETCKKARQDDLNQLRSVLKKVRAKVDEVRKEGETHVAVCSRLSAAYAKAVDAVHPGMHLQVSFSTCAVRHALNNFKCNIHQPAVQAGKASSKKICAKLHRIFMQELGLGSGSFGQCGCNRCRLALDV